MSPKPYAVVRRISVRAEPSVVHERINDFHNWMAWSPWEGLDPAMKRSFSGPESGVGAAYSWSGNRKAGAGSMTITKSSEQAINIDLTFDRPFPAEDQLEFKFAPVLGGTEVTWTLHGELEGFMKIASLVWPMDKLLGPDFERGLARLKAVVEA